MWIALFGNLVELLGIEKNSRSKGLDRRHRGVLFFTVFKSQDYLETFGFLLKRSVLRVSFHHSDMNASSALFVVMLLRVHYAIKLLNVDGEDVTLDMAEGLWTE
ncbi:hypothetical protein ZIOFF_024293 [Zingiber officinale]|uniref:Uncharacterized protein n=1 Tax=Zingiber officinale TaxID=94328 RepID=A0A8J5H050_ZINOF|nr:hypothetical protein ZIOFF_024293 [Zingiber officinale]